MPTQSTLTSPLGTPVYTPDDRDHELFASTTRFGRIVPLVVGGIGAAIIVGGAILYGAGVIGAPLLRATEEADTEPNWQPNPEFSQTLGVQALQNLDDIERRESGAGSLLPPERLPRQPGMTVSPPRDDEVASEREMWEPPIQPKPPEGTEDLPKAADPQRTVPNGYADDPRPRNSK